MKLYIGNKNYSSWSMRPWVMLKNAEIAFEEVMIKFDHFEPNSAFKQAISKLSPTAKVPLLVDGEITVWDTLSIAEYAAEKYPEKQLWPADRTQRAHARSICAEMHSGFGALRNHCAMNIEASMHDIGAVKLRDEAGVRADVQRIEQMWTELLAKHGGPYLFGTRFTIADAYFAPVCMRFKTYTLTKKPQIKAYIEAVSQAPGVREWIAEALLEKDFVAADEPYRSAR